MIFTHLHRTVLPLFTLTLVAFGLLPNRALGQNYITSICGIETNGSRQQSAYIESGEMLAVTRVVSHNRIEVLWRDELKVLRIEGISNTPRQPLIAYESGANALRQIIGDRVLFYPSTVCRPLDVTAQELYGAIVSTEGKVVAEELIALNFVAAEPRLSNACVVWTNCLLIQQGLAAQNYGCTRQPFSRVDMNCDGVVNSTDIAKLKANIAMGPLVSPRGDLDLSGIVDEYDVFLALKSTASPGSLQPFPLRQFQLDTRGKRLDESQDDLTGKNKPILTETPLDSSAVLRSWRVRYEKKGQMREMCSPPMLNVSFDKDFPTFNGASTMGAPPINYQEIRMTPDCDYWRNAGSVYHIGKFPVFGTSILMREYLANMVMRILGVATVDSISFSRVRFQSAEYPTGSRYLNYVTYQLMNEQDDQVPFAQQRGLSLPLFESDNTTARYFFDHSDETYKFEVNGTAYPAQFDFAKLARYDIVSQWIGLTDNGFLWANQDYGRNATTGLFETLPYSLDFVLGCDADTDDRHPERPELPVLPTMFFGSRGITSANGAQYKVAYNTVARQIFDNPASLHETLLQIDRFPFPAERRRLKNFLQKSFYLFALYFESQQFATSAGVTRVMSPQREAYKKALSVYLQSAKGNAQDPKCDATIRKYATTVTPRTPVVLLSNVGASPTPTGTPPIP